jgi:hypothetical protein
MPTPNKKSAALFRPFLIKASAGHKIPGKNFDRVIFGTSPLEPSQFLLFVLQPAWNFLLFSFQLEWIYMAITGCSNDEASQFRIDWNLKRPQARDQADTLILDGLPLSDWLKAYHPDDGWIFVSPNFQKAIELNKKNESY